MVGKSYDSNRFSSLNEINASNVASLRVITAAPVGGTEPGGFGAGSMQGTPLADNGFLYVSDPWGTPYKFDLSDGKSAKVVWVCDTGIEKDPTAGIVVAHRGLALAGKPVPMFDPEYRPGDNLFTNSTVALDADSGQMKWYFQYTPGDYMDYDEIGPQLLLDTKINGEDRKVLAHFGRNGLFYDLDRNSGAYIQSGQYVGKLTWTKGLDPKTGMPVEYDPTKSLQTYAIGKIDRAGAKAMTCPNIQGGTNFFPTGYNPTIGVAYAVGIEGCSDLAVKTIAPADVKAGQLFQAGSSTNNGVQTGTVSAIDVATGKMLTQKPTPFPMYSGVMATPDLVWAGSTDGTFAAYDAKTLDVKWSMNVGTGFQGSPIAFTAGGKEYIAIMGGNAGQAWGHPELENKSIANIVWIFGL